jgi:DNA (cytosine-5)-methyltransferase 1
MIKLRNGNIGFATDSPVHTVTSGGLHIGEVRTLLQKHGDGINCRGTVLVNGEWYQIVDIGMRMLQPHELAAAQGFPEDYILNVDSEGNSITKTAQVSGIGNSVSPVIPAAMVRENLPEMCEQDIAAA